MQPKFGAKQLPLFSADQLSGVATPVGHFVPLHGFAITANVCHAGPGNAVGCVSTTGHKPATPCFVRWQKLPVFGL